MIDGMELRKSVLALFELMRCLWGSKFDINYRDVDKGKMVNAWCNALSDLSPFEFKRGIESLRHCGSSFPPGCAEFRKLCCPALDPEVAYHEAMAGISHELGVDRDVPFRWSNLAIAWATYSMWDELGKQTYSSVRGKWQRVLEKEVAKHHSELPPTRSRGLPFLPPLTLEAKQKGREQIRNLKKLLRG